MTGPRGCPLADRELELATIAGALAEGRQRRGSLVLVTGRIGIGRSTLLAAAGRMASADGMLVLSAQAGALEQDFDRAVARQLLGPVVTAASHETRRRWRAGGAELAALALDDSEPGTPPTGLRNALSLSLRALVADLATERPVACLVDDVQWADTQSLACLAALARGLADLPVVVVARALDGDVAGDRPLVRELTSLATWTLRPGPLSADAVDRIVRDRIARGWPETPAERLDDLVLRATADSGGNPLFLDTVLPDPVPGELEPAAGLSRDSALHAALAATLARQTEPVREFAQVAAAVGDDIEPALIGRLAGLDMIGTNDARRVLSRLGLLPTGRPPLVLRQCLREVVEDAMPPAEYERLQLCAARMLHTYGYPAERVAACLLAVTNPPADWSTEVLRSASDAAAARGDAAASAYYLRRALLHHPAHGRQRAELLVEMAAAERSVDPTAAVRHMSQAVAALPSTQDRAAAVVRLPPSVFGYASPTLDEQLGELTRTLGRPDDLTGVEHELALRLEARSRFARHEDGSQLADAVRRLHGMGPTPCLDTWAHRELVCVLLYSAMLSTAVPAAEVTAGVERLVALQPVAPLHLHTTLPQLLACVATAGTTAEVSSWLDAVTELAQRQKSVADRAFALSARCLLALRAGRLQAAVRGAEQLCQLIATESGEVSELPSVALQVVALSANDAALTSRVLTLCPQRHDGPGGLWAWASRQLLDALARADEDTRAALDQVLDAGRRLDRAGWTNPAVLSWRTWAVRLHARLTERQQAVDLAQHEHELAVAWGSPPVLGRSLRLLASLLDGTDRVAKLTECVDLLSGTDDELELARAIVALGSAVLDVGGEPDADQLKQGLALAQRAGAPWLVDRARTLLGACGVRAAPGGTGLTTAERRIAELAVAGRSNQDIAAEFGITRRAVEKHLTNCYRKLDIGGRSDLATALQRIGSPREQ
jgi:DNA-binding CsgD family transcriptional regulator